jgi:hypothetical protein
MNTIELENIKTEAQIVDYLKRESSSKAMFNTIVDFVQAARKIVPPEREYYTNYTLTPGVAQRFQDEGDAWLAGFRFDVVIEVSETEKHGFWCFLAADDEIKIFTDATQPNLQ